MEATECGAACLAMVLGHYHSWVPLEEVRITAGVSRDGSNALNLVRAARNYGLEAHGYSPDAEAVKDLPGPVIAFWEDDHYVVLERYRRGHWQINDPASGRRTVTDEEFKASYSGVALVMSPGEGFVARSGGRERFVRTLLRPLEASASGVVYALLAGLALVIPTLAASMLAGLFVQYVLAEGRTEWLSAILWGVAAVVVTTLALTALQQYVLLRLQMKLALKMSTTFLWHVLRVPVAFFHERFSGTLVSRVQINSQIAELLSGTAATTIINLITMAAYAVAMVAFNPLLAGVAVLFALGNVVALRLAHRHRVEGNEQVLKEMTSLDGVSYHGLNSIESMKARGGESDFFRRWSDRQARYLNAQQRFGIPTSLLGVVPNLVSMLNTLAVLSVGAWLVIEGRMQVNELVSFQIIATAFLAPVGQLSGIAGQIQKAHAQVGQIDDVLSYEVDPFTEQRASGPARRLNGAVELVDVTFGYSQTEDPLLENFSLSIRPGGRVALVGRSGCGKSTVGNLVAGLYEPWSGQVLLDGTPRGQLDRSVVTSSLAKVDQQIFLFGGSVADNLRLWDDSLPRQRLIEAARDAAIETEIVRRPGALDARVAEGGSNFSGGQAQRLEIARALATNPRILVMDEATSALDTRTERMIDDALRRRGLTTLVIAHRLSTIRDADEIIVMDGGAVVQRGTHEQLMATPGLYRELIDA